MASRLRGLVEAEDVLLALWALAVERVLAGAVGRGPVDWVEPSGGGLPLAAWVLLGGLLFTVASEHDPTLTLDQALVRRVLACGPLVFVLAILGSLANHVRRVRLKAALPPGTPWSRVPEVGGWPGPHAPRWLRRAAVVPLALAGEAAVRHYVADAVDVAGGGIGDVFTHLVVPFASTLGGYLFFVVGPRVAAGATVHPAPWLLRFGSYFVALLAGRLVGP